MTRNAGPNDEELRKSLRAVKDGKSADVVFETDIIDDAAQVVLHERLSSASTQEEVKAAFETLAPWVGDVTITEDDIRRAFAEWDRLMPDYRGLLDADVEEE